ncbi:GTPase domain-containing protein [Planomonospora algeriensis]
MARNRIAFRCMGKSGRGNGCDPRADEVLGAFRGGAAPLLPPVFSVRRPGRRAECPDCRRETGWRVCPECHSRLPAEYCANPGKIVALVGAKGSGKSTYIAVLLHELMNRVGAELDASLVPCDDRTIERYKQDFSRPLYGQNRLPEVTQSAANSLRDPLVYLLTRTIRGRLRSRTESLTLVLFDTAGEDLRSRDVTEMHLRYLNAADSVIFLVDPLELPGARDSLNGAARAASGALADDPDSDPVNVISRVTELLRHRGGGGAVKIPVAVALSKIDALQPSMERQSALHRARERIGALDLDDREAVHEQIRALLDGWQAAMLDRYLRQNYADYAFFGLSALGAVPEPGRVGAGGIRPYRVEDPLLWLLHRFKMLDGVRR